ncbi:UBP1-associated protein 2A-like [Ananas comosus]|uniref:UBP1-associated protein 2A-like n=1 Tax=Ananas comosus TaxID=4615 RepID=A0A6P5ENR1_ANACO|nr:UBP1-associated protein 2A-like [Ananas comosus]
MTSARSSPTPAPLKPPAPSPSASSPSPVSTASSPAPAEPSSGSRSVASCPGSPSPTSLSPATRASTAAAASVQVISVRSARSLLRSSAARDLRTLDEILSVADADPFNSKLFVHGLGWETTSEGLRAVFARYGEIEDCRIGFVQFRHWSSASRALREPQRLIDNCMTACQLASTKLTPH